MTYQLTVKAGLSNVFVAGQRHQGGDVVFVPDDQYGEMSASAVSSLFSKVYSGGTVSHQVTIAPGLVNVMLPNLRRANGGEVVVLSDAQYSTIGAAAKTALFSADTTSLT